ncbi:unnamed protein product [Moneuplotes crassus]|uniref:dual-specificity kinase n=1 Tax=Euplotes crassus TaxID=5936 RepID=A0AAD1Y098_EUPCR|nr:unnamed protein product [Moneuplotes crassus]
MSSSESLNNSFHEEENKEVANFNINKSRWSFKGKNSQSKPSRKDYKSHQQNSSKVNARRNLNTNNVSMLSQEDPEMINENRRRAANGTAAPDAVIYQQFFNYQTFFGNKTKKRSSGTGVNPAGMRKMSGISKISNNKLFSSIGSGPIETTAFEAPSISKHQKRSLGNTRGSIEQPRSKIMKNLNSSIHSTTRNFSSIINHPISLNNSMALKQSANKESLNNSLITEGNQNLLPLNKINKNMKKRLNNLRNKEIVNKPIKVTSPAQIRTKRNLGATQSLRNSTKVDAKCGRGAADTGLKGMRRDGEAEEEQDGGKKGVERGREKGREEVKEGKGVEKRGKYGLDKVKMRKSKVYDFLSKPLKSSKKQVKIFPHKPNLQLKNQRSPGSSPKKPRTTKNAQKGCIKIPETFLNSDRKVSPKREIIELSKKKLNRGSSKANGSPTTSLSRPITTIKKAPPKLKLPISTTNFVEKYSDYLVPYEVKEIMNYPTVYYINAIERKQGKLPKQEGDRNYGWSKLNGEFLYEEHDMIAYRYEIRSVLGKGSFGTVFKCYDYKEKDFIAIKVIRCRKKLQKQGMVEVSLLKHLKEHDKHDRNNIVRIKNHFYWRNHLCICFESLSINLYDYLKKNMHQGFSIDLIRRFAIQILISLDYLEQHRIVHCDLKPENILLRKPTKSGIKLIDFGSSCFRQKIIYTYIQSRFYRAPEILLGIDYTCAIDMWSFGCILYELYTGYPLFAGEDENEQIQLIMEIKGVPPVDVITQGSRWKSYFHSNYNPRSIPNSKNKTRVPNSKTLRDILKCDDEDFLDIIDKCIEWKVEDRLRPKDALQHKWIKTGLEKVSKGVKPSSKLIK